MPEGVGGGAPSRQRLLLLWLSTATLAFLLCLQHFSATLIDGQFIPADHDSFYHARRILDAVDAPLSVLQFDSRIHAPQGSWVTWPWAYDASMAALATVATRLFGVQEPLNALVFVAPVWVYVNASLVLLIALRLRLTGPLLGLAMLCFACSTLTRSLHRVGMLDHHFIEYSFVLAVLAVGLLWFAQFAHRGYALLLGVILGAAPAFHNGLFIIQLPILLSLLAVWLCGRPLPPASMRLFCSSLLVTSFALLLPSEPFRAGMFAYSLHSWFHLYVSFSTSVVVLYCTVVPARARAVGLLVITCAVLTVPIANQILQGSDFVFGNLTGFEQLYETNTVWSWVAGGRWWHLSELYSGLIWLLPLAILALLLEARYDVSNERVFFIVMTLFGTALLSRQFRLEYFGSFALFLPWLVIVTAALDRYPHRRRQLYTLSFTIALVAYLPSLNAARANLPPGNDINYFLLRDIYPVLHEACQAESGVVLAEPGDGHYIIYHSACAVISNNFILTPQHERKVVESKALLTASLDSVLRNAPWLRYIYVRRADNIYDYPGCYPACDENAGLRSELLSRQLPADHRLRLLYEKRIQRGDRDEPMARLFKIIPAGKE
jgi:hypothetical protein